MDFSEPRKFLPNQVMVPKPTVHNLLIAYGFTVLERQPHVTNKGKETTMRKYQHPKSGEILMPHEALLAALEQLEAGIQKGKIKLWDF